MEVFIREKEKGLDNFAVYLVGKKFDNGYFEKPTETIEIPLNSNLKSLDQHDLEIRKQVIAELEEWVEWYCNKVYGNYAQTKIISKSNLQEKLNEMKGEKDE